MRLESAAPPRGQAPTQIGLYGRAPLHCAPTLQHVALDGLDLSIELRTPETGCSARDQTPFSLHIDPSRSTGQPILPGQVYRVRAYSGSGGSTSLVAFQLLDTNPPDSAAIPENGFWWPVPDSGNMASSSIGQGASLEWQDGQLAAGLFGFSDAGTPAWYFGSTRPHGRIADISLVELVSGEPLFAAGGAQPAAQAGPRLMLEFMSPARLRAWLVSGDAGRNMTVRSLLLSRSRFTTDAVGATWADQWVLVADESDAVAPRRFEFADSGSPNAQGFHLADSAHDANLDCRVADTGALPDLCTLSVASMSIADFDQIGIDHLSGRDSHGARVTLMRIPR